jgi:peroxiredoxin
MIGRVCLLLKAILLLLLLDCSKSSGLSYASEPSALPRYHFDVGQEITYKGEADYRYEYRSKPHSFGSRLQLSVWVIGKNKTEGTTRLVIRSAETVLRDGKPVRAPQTTLAYCDLYEDGRFARNPSLGLSFDPARVFPRLPSNRAALEKGWDVLQDDERGRSTFTLVSAPKVPEGLWTFREADKSLMDEISLKTHVASVAFDARRGLVTRIDRLNTDAYGYGEKSKGTESCALIAVERHDPVSMRHFADEVEPFFRLTAAYDDLCDRAPGDAKTCRIQLEEAKGSLLSAQNKHSFHVPMFVEQLAELVREHDRVAKEALDKATLRSQFVGRSAADFELSDLGGKRHSLKDYRGKVVILDFWYRSCGWCMRAMPQVKELAAEFRGQPVVMLGISTDRDAADARFVADKLKLDWTILRTDWDLPKKYGVDGYPTLVIIDPEGRIRDLHKGYTPSLQKEVSQTVRDLLGTQTGSHP